MHAVASSPAPLWDVKDAAQYFKKSPSWVYKRVEDGTLPCVFVGGSVRFNPPDLHEWVVNQLRGSRTERP